MPVSFAGNIVLGGVVSVSPNVALPPLKLNQVITGTSANQTASSSFTSLAANSLIVLSCAADSSIPTTLTMTITSNPSLTWVKSVDPTLNTNSQPIFIYTAKFNAGGNLAVTASTTDTLPSGFIGYAFTNYNTNQPTGSYTVGSNRNVNFAEQYSTGSIYITGSNSYIIGVAGDWDGTTAQGYPTVTFVSSSVLVWSDTVYGVTYYTAYHYWSTGSSYVAGNTYNFGNTSPSNTQKHITHAFLEILSQ